MVIWPMFPKFLRLDPRFRVVLSVSFQFPAGLRKLGTVTDLYIVIWIGSAVFAVGASMLHTLKVNSPHGIWIGYQILAGAGSGAAIQLPFIAVQVVLDPKDMPTGNAIAIFFNSLGGAIAISVAENIFTNTLIKKLIEYVPGVNPEVVVNAGAQHISDVVTPAQLPGTLLSYDIAITTAFILPIATACLAFLASWLFEWRSVKGANILGAGGGA